MRELRITNLEPLILDPGAGVSNERETLDYIPASRLRGAVFAAIEEMAPGVTPDQILAYDGPRWSNAWPADENWKPLMPAPKSLKKEKGSPVGWIKRTLNQKLEPAPPRIEVNMSVARHYRRRSHLDSALYARSALSLKQKFVAWVDSDAILNQTHEISLGTRHSVNGLCRVEVLNGGPTFATYPPSSECALLLRSDAIIRRAARRISSWLEWRCAH